MSLLAQSCWKPKRSKLINGKNNSRHCCRLLTLHLEIYLLILGFVYSAGAEQTDWDRWKLCQPSRRQSILYRYSARMFQSYLIFFLQMSIEMKKIQNICVFIYIYIFLEAVFSKKSPICCGGSLKNFIEDFMLSMMCFKWIEAQRQQDLLDVKSESFVPIWAWLSFLYSVFVTRIGIAFKKPERWFDDFTIPSLSSFIFLDSFPHPQVKCKRNKITTITAWMRCWNK